MPWSGLEVFREKAQPNRQRIGDVEANGGNRSNRYIGCEVPYRGDSQDKRTYDSQKNGITRCAPPIQAMPEIVEWYSTITREKA